jgi:hypothetical protein
MTLTPRVFIGSNPSKGKVIPVLNVIKPYGIKAYGEFRYCPTILDLGTRRCVVSYMPLLLYPRDTHWIGGWVGPRAGLDTMEKRKNPCPCQESNPGCPACSLVAIPTELSQLLF